MLKLNDFLQLYLDWVDGGAPQPSISKFTRSVGLCNNLVNYIQLVGDLSFWKDHWRLKKELHARFEADGLNTEYPFNEEGAEAYSMERVNNNFHLNPKRIAWIRNQLKE